jgi:hypothetical protein
MVASNVPEQESRTDESEAVSAVNVTSERLPLIDVLDRVLDKGIVITYDVSVSIVGLRVIEVVGKTVVASFDTYLRFADRSSAEGQQIDALTSAVEAYLRSVSADRH